MAARVIFSRSWPFTGAKACPARATASRFGAATSVSAVRFTAPRARLESRCRPFITALAPPWLHNGAHHAERYDAYEQTTVYRQTGHYATGPVLCRLL